MKKALIGIILLVLIGGGGFFVYQTFLKKTLQVEEILPAGPLAYLKVQNLDENLAEFTSTGFWKKIESIDYEKAAAVDPDLRDAYLFLQQFSHNVLTEENKKFIRDFLGEEFALVIYPGAIDQLVTGNIPGAMQQMTFVTKLNPQFQIQETIAAISSKFMKNTQITTTEYQGYPIHLVDSGQGMQFGYVRIGDYLVMGAGNQSARSAVDRAEGRQPALAEDEKFRTTQDKLFSDADSIAYADLEIVVTYMKALFTGMAGQASAGMEEADAALIRQQYEEVIRQWNGFRSLAYSGRFGLPVSSGKINIHFVLNEMDPKVRPLYECSPGQNDSFKMIPGTALAYQWSGCILLDHYWKMYQEELGKMPRASAEQQGPASAEAMIEAIEQQIGLDIEDDILAAFGDEIGGFLLDIDSSGVVPLPSVAFFIEVGDQGKVEQLIGTLLNNYAFFRPNAENYGNSVIEYIQIPFVSNLEPGYSLVGNYLVLATNRDALRGAIDTFEGRTPALSADAGIEKAGPEFTEAGNLSVTYIRVGEIAQRMEGVVQWVNQWVSAQEDKQLAFKAGTEQRLKDIEKDIADQKENLRKSQEELSKLQQLPDEQQTPEEEIGSLEEEIEMIEQSLESSLQTQTELEEIIKGYEDQVVAPQTREILTDEVVKPLLGAFQSIGTAAGRTIIKDNAVQFYFYTTFE